MSPKPWSRRNWTSVDISGCKRRDLWALTQQARMCGSSRSQRRSVRHLHSSATVSTRLLSPRNVLKHLKHLKSPIKHRLLPAFAPFEDVSNCFQFLLWAPSFLKCNTRRHSGGKPRRSISASRSSTLCLQHDYKDPERSTTAKGNRQ